MGVFTQLGAEELGEIARVFSLGIVKSFDPIAAGTINSNYRLETSRGLWFVRVNEGKAEVDVAWEARLVEALAAAGVATPAPMAVHGTPYAPLPGTRKWVSVFPWRDGGHLAPTEVSAQHASEIGAALATLHVAGLALPEAWRRGSIYDHDHLVTRYQHFESSLDPQLASAIEILGEELAIAARAASTRRRATHGIIHGDLFRDNVLWERQPKEGGARDAKPRVTAVLDFEQASGGSLAYDLGVCINDWCWTGSVSASGQRPSFVGEPRLDLVRALLDGYQRKRKLTPGDREALPIEVRAAATRFTITRITDVYLARVDNPDKDFRAFLARVQAWRGPVLGQLASLL